MASVLSPEIAQMTIEERGRHYEKRVAELHELGREKMLAGKRIGDPPIPKIPRAARIYFVLARNLQLVKIGVAIDPDARLGALQSASPDRLVLLGSIYGFEKIERQIHRQFHSLRSHGEWFHFTDELRAFIEREVGHAIEKI